MKKMLSLASLPLIVGLLLAPITTMANTGSSTALSPAASAAFGDVGRCLATGKTKKLSVYYLIDNSRSLTWTDPENDRQEILAGSIQQLGKFADQGIQVQVAAGLFSSRADNVINWRPLTGQADAKAAADLASSQISNEITSGSTNWEAGLKLAYDQLSVMVDSCKMLVWFTDGGINPDNTLDAKFQSLSNLCRPGISTSSLGMGSNYGLMSAFRNAQIPVFGVLYNNVEAATKYFQTNSPNEVQDRLAEERWSMSFMRALVEGRGEIPEESFYGEQAVGGVLDCATVNDQGIAPPESVNGAFLNAEDPVALAFQFLKLETQISGGAGSIIQDGKFTIPSGTAKFRVLVNGERWSIAGPEGSGISATPSSPNEKVKHEMSSGASLLDVVVIDDPLAEGDWTIDTQGTNTELFLFPGLTFALDRDATSKILSEYPNTLTGKVVRTPEFEQYLVELGKYPEYQVRLSYLSNGQRILFDGAEVEIAPNGEFAVKKLVPPKSAEQLELWLTLDLGPNFNPVESKFVLDVQDKSAMVSASTDDLRLSNLIGPSGMAKGFLTLQGPNTSDSSTFCFSNLERLEDSQTGIEKVERAQQFIWSFRNVTTGEESDCFTVLRDAQIDIQVSAMNSTQASAEVVSVWTITAESPSVGVKFEAPLRISFESETESNSAVTWIVFGGLLFAGLLLPLIILWLLNFLTTRFLPIEGVTKASIPVFLDPTGSSLKVSDGRPGKEGGLIIEPRDFLNVSDQPAPKVFETGQGRAQARIPVFPLKTTWYEWKAPEGSRILSSYLGASKTGKTFEKGLSTEVSPNMKENWALTVSEAELLKKDSSPLKAQLTVFSSMLPLAGYQARVSKAIASNGLSDRIKSLRKTVLDEVAASNTAKPGPKDIKPDSSGVLGPLASGAPPIFGSSKLARPPMSQSNPPPMPGFGPPNLPGGNKPPGPPPIS